MGEIEVPPHLGVTANELMTSQVLFLKSRQITDLDCAAIAPCLKQNASLRQLFIGYNEFGDEGARHLCEALAAVEGVTWKLSKKHFGSFVVHKQLDRCMRFRRAESGRCKLWVQKLKCCSCYAGCHVNMSMHVTARLPGGVLELVGFRHCKLGNGAAQAVADFIKSSKTIVDTWTQFLQFVLQ